MEDRQLIGGELDGKIVSAGHGFRPVIVMREGAYVGQYNPRCFVDDFGKKIVVYVWPEALNSSQPTQQR